MSASLPSSAATLSPRLRAVLGTAQNGRCLRGLVHHRTLAALEARGLVKTAGHGDTRGPITCLTVRGISTRDELRESVYARLEAEGWQRGYPPSGSFWRRPGSRRIFTRAAAMREAGVSY